MGWGDDEVVEGGKAVETGRDGRWDGRWDGEGRGVVWYYGIICGTFEMKSGG